MWSYTMILLSNFVVYLLFIIRVTTIFWSQMMGRKRWTHMCCETVNLHFQYTPWDTFKVSCHSRLTFFVLNSAQAFQSKNRWTRPDTFFHPLIRLQQVVVSLLIMSFSLTICLVATCCGQPGIVCGGENCLSCSLKMNVKVILAAILQMILTKSKNNTFDHKKPFIKSQNNS